MAFTKRSDVEDIKSSSVSVVHEFRKRTSTGHTVSDGAGLAQAFIVETTDKPDGVVMAFLGVVASDVTDDTEDSYFELRNRQGGTMGHADIRSKDTSVSSVKAIRLNSRNYVNTSGDATAVEAKPRATVTTTGELRGFHAMPNVSDDVDVGAVQGFFSELYFRGGTAATIGYARAFYGRVLDDTDGGTPGTRTYTNPVCVLWAEASLHSNNTFSGGLHVMNVVKGAYKDWDSLVRFSATGGACTVGADGMVKDPENDQEAGFISIYVGATRYEVPIYAVT